MPTYAYRCDACGHGFDAFQKFADAPLTDCPACEGRVRRVIHPTPVVFKGSGWYITDSRTKPSTNGSADKSDGDGAKAAAGKDAGKDGGKGESGKADGATASAEKKSDKAPAEKAPAKVAAD